VGAALAGEIRQEKQTARADVGFFGLFDQQFIGIDAAPLGGVDFIVRELISEPLKRSAGRKHAAKNAPLARDGVAHGVNAAFGVERGLITVSEDDAGRAEGCAHDAGGDNPVADSASGLVATAADDRNTGDETEFFRHSPTDFSAYLI